MGINTVLVCFLLLFLQCCAGQTQNCTTHLDCQYEDCQNDVLYGCNCNGYISGNDNEGNYCLDIRYASLDASYGQFSIPHFVCFTFANSKFITCPIKTNKTRTTTTAAPTTVAPITTPAPVPPSHYARDNFVLVHTHTNVLTGGTGQPQGISSYYTITPSTNTLQLVRQFANNADPMPLAGLLENSGDTMLFAHDDYTSAGNTNFARIHRLSLTDTTTLGSPIFLPTVLQSSDIVKDGTLNTAKFRQIKKIVAPRSATFLVTYEFFYNDQAVLRRVDLEQNYVKTILAEFSRYTLLDYDVAPNGLFVVYGMFMTLYKYTFPATPTFDNANTGTLTVLSDSGELKSIQAVVISPDSQWVFIADLTGEYPNFFIDVVGFDMAQSSLHTFIKTSYTAAPAIAMGNSMSGLWLATETGVNEYYVDYARKTLMLRRTHTVSNVRTMSVWTRQVVSSTMYDTAGCYRQNLECTGAFDAALQSCAAAQSAVQSCLGIDLFTTTSTTALITTTSSLPTSLPPATTSTLLTTSTTPALGTTSPGLSKVDVALGEYCAGYYTGFSTYSYFRVGNADFYSNTQGCNGAPFEITSSVTGRTVSFVCPWPLNYGCSVVQDGDYYFLCDSGCYSKLPCPPAPTHAYYVGSGTSPDNCPYNCDDNYVRLANGSCAQLAPAQQLPVPETPLRRCTQYAQCSHCPVMPFLGTTFYRVWGCSGYDVRLWIMSETYTWRRPTSLLPAYCVYVSNETHASYCPEPVIATPPPSLIQNLSVVNVTVPGASPQPFTAPHYRCSAYANCSFCPSPFTSGCSGVSVVQRFPSGAYGAIFRNFAPKGMMQRYCVYLSNGEWSYCPDESMPYNEVVVVKKSVSFFFNVPEAVVTDAILAKYRRRISQRLDIPESLIELQPGLSAYSGRRRLLADNLVYASMQLDPDKADAVNLQINDPNFFNQLFSDEPLNVTAATTTLAAQPAPLQTQPPSQTPPPQQAPPPVPVQVVYHDSGSDTVWYAAIGVLGGLLVLVAGAYFCLSKATSPPPAPQFDYEDTAQVPEIPEIAIRLQRSSKPVYRMLR